MKLAATAVAIAILPVVLMQWLAGMAPILQAEPR